MVDYSIDIKECCRVLANGGTIVYPTDTVWGVGCDATNATAIEKVFALKHRPAHKSMIILVTDVAMLEQYTTLSPVMRTHIQAFSRPTTVIYSQASGIAANALAADGSIGIRVVNDDFCRQMIRTFGKPIISTSANISGRPAPALFREIEEAILTNTDYVPTYRRNDDTQHSPSQIIRFDSAGEMIIIRE